MLLERADQRTRHVGTVALGDIRNALVGDLAQDHQRLLGAGLVVEGHDLDLFAEDAALLVDLLGLVAEVPQAGVADVSQWTGQRFDISDLDRVLRTGSTQHGEGTGRSEQQPAQRARALVSGSHGVSSSARILIIFQPAVQQSHQHSRLTLS